MKIVPKSWRDFQHYKDRNPPWIRLHKALLDNYEFQCLPVASRALAPMLWLIASDATDGVIDANIPKLAFRLRQTEAEVREALKPLIDNGFFYPVDDAINLLAERKQDAVPETETETENNPPTPRKRGECVSEGFANFWSAYPPTVRKAAKQQCWDKWRRRELEPQAAQIVAHVKAMSASEAWRKDGGAFVPAPLVYLNQSRFEAPTESQVAATNWRDSRSGIEAKGEALGLGRWDEYACSTGKGEPFKAYERRVVAAAECHA